MNVIFQLESFIFIQILAPNADAEGQHPDLTGFASLRQDWHRAKRKENALWAFLAKESDCRGGKTPYNEKARLR